jgi:hypothetical protein
MSILVVHLVPEGLLFAADRNITTWREGGGLRLIGQAQRPKVLKWPNTDAIIGYVGQANISGVMTDEWLYAFIGRNLTFASFESLADALANDLNDAMSAGEIDTPLIIHLGGFENVAGEWTPRIWFVRNTTDLSSAGYTLGGQFDRSEEIAQPTYFGSKSGNQIRDNVTALVQKGALFSFRQGYDLAAFNAIDEGQRAAMKLIVVGHPLSPHQFPASLDEWSKHLRMAVLSYGAYFGAFFAPFEQYVGGGADVVTVPWP